MEKTQTILDPKEISEANNFFKALNDEFARNIVGQQELLAKLIITLVAGGNILLEGVPGLAKTRAVNVLAKAIQLSFKRIQFTPDLLPADIIGNQVFNPKTGEFYTKTGPVFANLVLADEINRAPSKVQSALLEAMQERQVTIDEKTYKLPEPFMVLATQNPIEQQGTFPLPEAQIDRFLLKTVINYPTLKEEKIILDLLEKEIELDVNQVVQAETLAKVSKVAFKVLIDDKLKTYISNLTYATRYPKDYNLSQLEDVIEFGASPRASIAFMKLSKVLALYRGRDYVIPEDIKDIRHDVLRHRLILSFEAEAEGVKPEDVIDQIFNSVNVP